MTLDYKIKAIYYLLVNGKVPWQGKLFFIIAIAYAISPIDIVPDFIPLLGMLDDLLMVPALIWLGTTFIDKHDWEEALSVAISEPPIIEVAPKWLKRFGMLLVLLLWIVVIASLYFVTNL